MLPDKRIDSKIQSLRQRLLALIEQYETVPAGRKNLARAKTGYVTNSLKALRRAVQS